MLCTGLDDLSRLLIDWPQSDDRQAASQALQLVGTLELLVLRLPGDVAPPLQHEVVDCVQLFFEKLAPARCGLVVASCSQCGCELMQSMCAPSAHALTTAC